MTKYKVQKCVPYQKCPVCNGTGNEHSDTSAMSIACSVCFGAKIIPMHVVPEEPVTDEMLSSSKACKLLGVSRTTLWRMETEGKIVPVTVDNSKRYPANELKKLIKNGCNKAFQSVTN